MASPGIEIFSNFYLRFLHFGKTTYVQSEYVPLPIVLNYMVVESLSLGSSNVAGDEVKTLSSLKKAKMQGRQHCDCPFSRH